MSDTVRGRGDDTPGSECLGDSNRSAPIGPVDGLAQARQVFLNGCGLIADEPTAAEWAGAPRWSVLDTGFGMGLNFLATWHAWRQDARRPARLFYSAVDASPPEASELLRSAAPFPELAPLAAELAAHWHGLLPGVHRLPLDGDRVQLTLAIGDVLPALAELSGRCDTVFLDGSDPAYEPGMWSLTTIQAVARLARPGARLATRAEAPELRERLTACGFSVEGPSSQAPHRHGLRARHEPRWHGRQRARPDAPAPVERAARCIVIGAGLAGASVAYSLAQRGWQVTVLDRAEHPAAGASGLPAGVVAPHVSPDDRALSRLSRAGVRATLNRARSLLREHVDFGTTGVLERHAPGERRLPSAWSNATDSVARRPDTFGATDPLTIDRAAHAGVPLDAEHSALWHARAGWIRPAALVRAMLQTPGVQWCGGAAAARFAAHGAVWRVFDAADVLLAEAELVVITAGFDSLALLQAAHGAAPPLHALRGQVAHGPMPGGPQDSALPAFPVNGHGSLIAHLPGDAPDSAGWWITGSTFERANRRPEVLAADHAANHQRLAELLPRAGQVLTSAWHAPTTRAWAAVRATLPDRLPAVGVWQPFNPSQSEENSADFGSPSADTAIISGAFSTPLPMQMLTGLGARGLTLAVLCGEILAARLHGDPLPIERSLSKRLLAARWAARAVARTLEKA